MQRLKIAYITSEDAHNKHAWSGTTYYVAKSLQKHIGDVDFLGPVSPVFLQFICQVFNKISLLIFNKRFDYRHSRIMSKAYARIFSKKMQNKKYDLIVSPAGVGYVAYLKTTIPIVLICDRTIAGAISYHESLSKLWSFSLKQTLETEKLALQNCSKVIYSSTWAADAALKEYKIPEKIVSIPFGANMDHVIAKENIQLRLSNKTCKLLMVGTSWENKGGPIAYECLLELIKMGIDSELIIVGCVPPKKFKHDKFKVIPFLKKNIEADLKKMEELYLDANFFILPTRFDAFGIVFCEAASYGLPSLGSNTGGVGSALVDNQNGYLMPSNANGVDYAKKISDVWNNKETYKNSIEKSRKCFDEQLNWDFWAKSFEKTIGDL